MTRFKMGDRVRPCIGVNRGDLHTVVQPGKEHTSVTMGNGDCGWYFNHELTLVTTVETIESELAMPIESELERLVRVANEGQEARKKLDDYIGKVEYLASNTGRWLVCSPSGHVSTYRTKAGV